MDIRKDEHFLHPTHGVGKVQSIQKRSFSGHATASYVQIYFARDSLTVMMLEKDLPGAVRSLISASEASKLLAEAKAWKGKADSQWKSRANTHQQAIESGDPLEYFKVLKELSYLESQGVLRSMDRAHYNKSYILLTEELSCALGKSTTQVRKLIDKAIGAPPQTTN